MRYKKIKKRNQLWIWSLILCMCIILSGQSISAFAESQENEYIENSETDVQVYPVEEVKAMIDALPSVSEMEKMSEEEVNAVYEQAQKAYDAFETLTEEAQNELADGLEKLQEVLGFYTTSVEPLTGGLYVKDITIAYSKNETTAKNSIMLSSEYYTTWDINEGAGGKYIYLGYLTTDDPKQAITGLLLYVSSKDDKPDYYDKGGVRYYLHGKSSMFPNNTNDGAVDLNMGAGGDYIYLYCTCDPNAGSPLTKVMVTPGSIQSSGNDDTTKRVLATDGSSNVNPESSSHPRYIGYRTYDDETVSKRYIKLEYMKADGNATFYRVPAKNVVSPIVNWYPPVTSANLPTSVSYNGYTFQQTGWRTTAISTDFSPERTAVYVGAEDNSNGTILGAVYKSTVSVTYDANGGTSQPAAQSLTVYAGVSPANGYYDDNTGTIVTSGDATFTISSTAPTKSGICKFLGWSTDKNATTAKYTAGSTQVFKQDTTLYAVYQTNHTYSSNWSNDTTTHWRVATCGHSAIADYASHTWSGGKCTVCQYVCLHDGLKTGYCTICGSCLSNGEVLTAPKVENSIYLIYNPKELAWFSAYVNGKDASIRGKLMANIDMSSTAWNPIGTSGSPYTGTFEGNGKKVTLKFSSSEEYLAMFSYVNGATIQNLTVDGTIDISYHFAASIIGRVTGGTVTLKNCLSLVTINSSYDGDGTHGGLVSITASGTLNIQNCGFAGKMIGTQTYACGGMVGWTDKSAKTNISNSYVAAEFNLENNSGNTFGRNSSFVTVENCYYLNALSEASAATKMSAESFQSGEVTWLLNGKTASGVWKQTIDADGYPNFSGQTVYYGYKDCVEQIYTNDSAKAEKGDHPSFDSKGFCVKCGGYQPAVWNDSAGYYEIANAGQLFWFAELVNKDNKSVNGVLMNDIDLEGRAWTPIGLYSDDSAISANNAAYAGTFDGKYHVISNLSVNMTENYEAGLFGRVVKGGVLKNFGVIDAVVIQNQSGHENKGVRAGIIAGEIYQGTAENVFSAGSLTLETVHDQFGGLAGESKESTLRSCYTTYARLTDGTGTNAPATVTRCYYQAGEKNSTSAGTNMTAAQFISGEVTYMLNDGVTDGTQVWYQTIDEDVYPKFTGGTLYYHDKRDEYSNYDQITSVGITWTDINFFYSMGMWDAEKEIWNEGGWIAEEGEDMVTVKNTGTVEVTITFDAAITDDSVGISVSFMENDTPLEGGELKLDVEEQKTVTVKLTGDEPSENIEEGREIGQITVKVS